MCGRCEVISTTNTNRSYYKMGVPFWVTKSSCIFDICQSYISSSFTQKETLFRDSLLKSVTQPLRKSNLIISNCHQGVGLKKVTFVLRLFLMGDGTGRIMTVKLYHL